jgi:hypothetical protein
MSVRPNPMAGEHRHKRRRQVCRQAQVLNFGGPSPCRYRSSLGTLILMERPIVTEGGNWTSRINL